MNCGRLAFAHFNLVAGCCKFPTQCPEVGIATSFSVRYKKGTVIFEVLTGITNFETLIGNTVPSRVFKSLLIRSCLFKL